MSLRNPEFGPAVAIDAGVFHGMATLACPWPRTRAIRGSNDPHPRAPARPKYASQSNRLRLCAAVTGKRQLKQIAGILRSFPYRNDPDFSTHALLLTESCITFSSSTETKHGSALLSLFQ